MQWKIIFYIFALFLATFSNFTLAQTTDIPGAASTASLQTEAQKKDGVIIEILNVINQGEIAVAKLALQRSHNTAVKNFAETMIHDHSKSLEDTKQLSQKIGITPIASEKSDKLQGKNDKTLKKLNSTSDNEFDEKYIHAMVEGHEKV